MKIAVIGLGAAGSQVLWQLSRRNGIEVHGYDSLYPGHPFAGAGGESRLYRNFELSDLAYMPMIRRADELWHDLENACGRTLRRKTGVLLLGRFDNSQMQHALRSAQNTDKPYRRLSYSELCNEFPQFSFREADIGMWDTEGGVISPEVTIALAAKLSEENGARIFDHSRVQNIESRSNGVRIHVNGDSVDYDRIVIACGGWTTTLLPELKDEVVVKRLTSAWFVAREEGGLDRLPPFMQTAPSYCYGAPSSDGSSVKLGLGFNDHLNVSNPDEVQRHLSADDIKQEVERFSWIVRDLLPSLIPKPVRMSTYIESYTRSMHEYIRLHPEDSNIAVMTGFSGHGFKVSPAVGEIGAQLITTGETDIDINFLRDATSKFDIINTQTGETSFNAIVSSNNSTY